MVIDWASLGVFISVCSASLSGILHTVQQSRCKKINLCCGVFNCSREVPDVEYDASNITTNAGKASINRLILQKPPK